MFALFLFYLFLDVNVVTKTVLHIPGEVGPYRGAREG